MSRPGSRWRWWHVVLLVSGVAVVGYACWVLVAVAGLYGGFDDLLGGDPIREDDPAVTAARERASADLEVDVARLVGATVVPTLGRSATSVAAGEVALPCRVGQHNWKIDDDFDLVCGLQRVEVVVTTRRAAFRADMESLDVLLRAEGWDGEKFGLERVLGEYWDALGSVPRAEPGAGESSDPDFPDGYTMDDLPGASYVMRLDGQTRSLAVSWLESESRPTSLTYEQRYARFVDDKDRPVLPSAIVESIPGDGYAVVLTEQVEYFRG